MDNKTKQAMQIALENYEQIIEAANEGISKIREQMAQPKSEPVAIPWPEVKFEKVTDYIEVGYDLFGGVDIRLGGEFIYVHINYDYRYTHNAARRDLADKIVGILTGNTTTLIDQQHTQVGDVRCLNGVLVGYLTKELTEGTPLYTTPPVVPQEVTEGNASEVRSTDTGEPVGYWNGKETVWLEHELCGHPAPDDCTIPLYTATPSVEAAIEATKEKAAKVCEEKYQSCRFDDYRNACQDIAAAIRSMK